VRSGGGARRGWGGGKLCTANPASDIAVFFRPRAHTTPPSFLLLLRARSPSATSLLVCAPAAHIYLVPRMALLHNSPPLSPVTTTALGIFLTHALLFALLLRRRWPTGPSASPARRCRWPDHDGSTSRPSSGCCGRGHAPNCPGAGPARATSAALRVRRSTWRHHPKRGPPPTHTNTPSPCSIRPAVPPCHNATLTHPRKVTFPFGMTSSLFCLLLFLLKQFCGIVTCLIGLFVFPCVCCCPCDQRQVYTAPNGQKYPSQAAICDC
jgi:hypothetical protein